MKLRLLFLLSLAASCGARTDLGGARDASVADDLGIPGKDVSTADVPTLVATGIVINECSPNDGLQVTFVLALPGAFHSPTCSDPSSGTGIIRISFWSNIPQGPGDYAIGDGSFPSGSLASSCSLEDAIACVTADHGTLTITSSTPTSYSGSFTLVLPDQTTVSGSFSDAPNCNNSIMCG